MVRQSAISVGNAIPARLRIRQTTSGASDNWTFGSLMQRIRGGDADAAMKDCVLRRLEIRDLTGRHILGLDTTGTLVEVALPAGTYHVTTFPSGKRRVYTVALGSGTTVESRPKAERGRH